MSDQSEGNPETRQFEVLDSGKRGEYEGGMVRDTEDGKIDWLNVFETFEPMGTRLAWHLTRGREKPWMRRPTGGTSDPPPATSSSG